MEAVLAETAATAGPMDDVHDRFVVTVRNMAGHAKELPALSATSSVHDLALSVREHFGVPLCSMNLLKDGELLTDLTLLLKDAFDAANGPIELMVVRRALSACEQAELDKQLVRSTASGNKREVQEYLTEGAQLKPDEADATGGLTAMMMAVALGDQELCLLLREAGAEEPDMVTKHRSIALAFRAEDFVDIVRFIADGADVNMRLRSGDGIRSTSSGTPLHACCAMHRQKGSAELAQLLIAKKADVAAGDAEGDTPLAHAKYFGAGDIFEILESNGAELGGPYYRHITRCFGQK